MNTVVSISNIGAFVLQAVTLGLGVKSSTAPIRSILQQASSELHDAMEELIVSGAYLEDKEFFELRSLHDTHKESVAEQLQQELRRDGFLMTVTSYKSAKGQARFHLTECKGFRNEVSRISQQRRIDAQVRERIAKKQQHIENSRAVGVQQQPARQASNILLPVIEDSLAPPPLAMVPRYGWPLDTHVNNPFRRP